MITGSVQTYHEARVTGPDRVLKNPEWEAKVLRIANIGGAITSGSQTIDGQHTEWATFETVDDAELCQKRLTTLFAGSLWHPMETAPTDGTAVLLRIRGGEHPLQDENPSVSIGSFGVEGGPVEDPTWHFAGWSWHHDCYCRGIGEPIGWLPLPPAGAL